MLSTHIRCNFVVQVNLAIEFDAVISSQTVLPSMFPVRLFRCNFHRISVSQSAPFFQNPDRAFPPLMPRFRDGTPP